NFWSPWCDPNNPKYEALCEKYNYTIGDFGPINGWQLRHFGADYLLYNITIKANKKARENGGIIYNGDLSYTTKSTQEGIEWCLSRGFDQLKYMVDILQNDPFGSNGRRCMFSLWNPKDLDKTALPPCHFTYQAIADGDGGLTGILTQRSCDMFCGVPANIQF